MPDAEIVVRNAIQSALQFGATVALRLKEDHNFTLDCYTSGWAAIYDEFTAGTTIEHTVDVIVTAIRAEMK